MKLITTLTGLILLLLLVISAFTMQSVVANENQSSNYININSNIEFLNLASTNGWEGNGTKTNPYIISNEVFSYASYGIQLQNTNLWIVFDNVSILHCDNGILFDNVSNILIEDSIIANLVYTLEPITLTSSQNIQLTNVTIRILPVQSIFKIQLMSVLVILHGQSIYFNLILISK